MSRRAVPLLGLLVYIAAAIFVGALLAFPAYVGLERLTRPAFESVLHRVAALTLLALLPLYLASGAVGASAAGPGRAFRRLMGRGRALLATARPSRAAFGLSCTAPAFRRGFLRGFVLGVLIVLPLVGALLALGVRREAPLAPAVPDVAAYVAFALLSAALIGLIEEAYFRGALLAPLQRLPPWLAVASVSVVYAALHFVGAPVPAEDVHWASGLSSVARSEVPLDAFLGLLAAGLFLGALRLRFGHIAVGAGFHAGWVFVMKLNQEYTDLVPGSEWAFLEGRFGGTMGYLGLAWIAMLGAAWYAWYAWERRLGPADEPRDGTRFAAQR